MSKTVLILFAACVGLSLLSLHLVKQMRAGDAKIAELQAQIATLASQQQQAQSSPPPAAEPEPVAATPSPEPVIAQPAPAKEAPKVAAVTSALALFPRGGEAPTREERMRMMREHQERQRQLMEDPDYREAMRIQHRSGMARMYPGLGEELGMTAEETDRLFNLLADQQVRNNQRVQPLWDVEGADPAAIQQRQQKMQEEWAEAQRKNEAELAAHLGPQKTQAWKDYQSTLGTRQQVDGMSNSLASQGIPLSEDASRSVMKAMIAVNETERQEAMNMARFNTASQGRTVGVILGPGMQGGPNAEMYEQFLEQSKKRNQRMMDAISPYLTSRQRESIQREHDAQIKMQEAQIRIMRSQKNSTQGNASSSSAGNGVEWVQSTIVTGQ